MALVLIVATIVVVTGDSDPEAATATTGTAPTAPGGIDEPPPDLDAADEAIPALQAFVEQQRGVEFTEPVDVEVLATEAYEQRTTEQFRSEIEEDREDLEIASAQYQALGLLDPDIDIVETLETFYTTATAGFYDPESKELVVRGAELSADLRVTLVHELTHALDDQIFDLDRPELDDRSDEAGFGFSALVEGNASRVEEAYVESLGTEEQLEYFQQSGEAAAEIDLDAIPPVLLIEQQFVYGEGLEFVLALVEDGGNEKVDSAFGMPPLTTEAVLEPEAYLSDEGGEPVPTPPADGEIVDEGIGGQFLLELLVNGTLGADGVPEWVGDQYVTWEDGAQTCIRIAYVGDLDDLEDALAPWADRTGGAVERSGDTVTATGCTG
jgi:hypothetical protein